MATAVAVGVPTEVSFAVREVMYSLGFLESQEATGVGSVRMGCQTEQN